MIIETQNLTKKFGEHDAVSGISLSVPEGAMVALIGANGAGKTTTLRMLMNLLEADAGEARVLGVDSRRLTAREYSRIGYVSENQKLPLTGRWKRVGVRHYSRERRLARCPHAEQPSTGRYCHARRA